MTQMTGFWKIITPKTRKQLYTAIATDNYDPRGLSTSSAVNWYSQIMQGPGSRMQTYRQYDTMDTDIDISRSLDIIAEEMSGKDNKTNLPFEIQWQKEDNQDISDTTLFTVRTALRQWSQVQDLKKRIFSTARCMIKYGDCFFRKNSDTNKWQYVDPSRVVGIEVDELGNKISYHIKQNGLELRTSAFSIPQTTEHAEPVPAAAIIHFTTCDDMGDSAPFGHSVLKPIFRVYRQFTLLEDAVIIYLLVRAPQRRVFYLDVGNMNQQQVKRYLEEVKTGIRQKRIPGSQSNGINDSVDGQYDPQCFTMDTRIPLLDGRTLTLEDLITEHANGKQNTVFSCDPITGEIKLGEIKWAGVTRKNAELLKLNLNNGQTVTCTPDHKFPVLGYGFVRADELTSDMPLAAFAIDADGFVYDHSKNCMVSARESSENPAFKPAENINVNVTLVSVTKIAERRDTGCITVGENNHNWHTFALESGIFTKNSLQEDYFFPVTAAGKSSRVETLEGASENYGTQTLRQFQEKIFRGLRIPTSYLGGQEGAGAQTNDGKVGIAYIEELRFAKFIGRLQDRLNEMYDQEFKIYLKVCGLKIDDELFNIKLPDPANFALYKQAALDADLITSFNNIQEIKFLSRRFILKRYLGLSDDEIQMNELMLKEEKNLKENSKVPLMQQLYDDVVYSNREKVLPSEEDNLDDSSGGISGGFGGGFGGGLPEEEPKGPGVADTFNDEPPAEEPKGTEEPDNEKS
jgi:hypothetical protein